MKILTEGAVGRITCPKGAERDERLGTEIGRIWDENVGVHGVRQVRASYCASRSCTIERFMKMLGIQGVRRSARCWTTVPDEALGRSADMVNRQFVPAIDDVELATLEGWAVFTTLGYWSLSATCQRRNSKWRIIADGGSRMRQPDSNKMVSVEFGRIHVIATFRHGTSAFS